MIKTKFIDGKIIREIYGYFNGKEIYGGKVSRDLFSSKNKTEIEYSEDYKKAGLLTIDNLKEHLSDLSKKDMQKDMQQRECSFGNLRSSIIIAAINLDNIRIPRLESKCKCNTHTIMSMGCQCGGK